MDNMDLETDNELAVEDKISPEKESALHPLVAHVMERFEDAKTKRRDHEERWNRAYYNFRGLYGKEIQFTETEKSRVFVKITKTKVMASYGQIVDVLFSENKVPIVIEPTPNPTGVTNEAHIDLKDPKGEKQDQAPEGPPPALVGYEGDGQDLKPGETITDRLTGWLSGRFGGASVKEGAPLDPKTNIKIDPAKIAADRMNAKVHDQLIETNAIRSLDATAFECSLLGTGVVKGPFIEEKEYPKWDEEGNYIPENKIVPALSHTSLWFFYPDPEASTIDDAEFAIERHRMTRGQLRMLKKRPSFRNSKIEEVVDRGPNATIEWWEHEIDDTDQNTAPTSRWDVLEFWGSVDRSLVEDAEIKIPKQFEDVNEFGINVWVSGGEIIRAVLNPFKPSRIPYLVVPYERNPYSIFGVGCAENMEDSQTIMNGFARLTVDNAVLAGNIMIEVDEDNLVPGQDMRAYPGKTWRRRGGAPGQSIFATKWPNTINENMIVFDKFRQFADESTGITSYSHGQTGISGTTRTASGMSMLMGASALNVKTVIKNWDNYVLRPLGESLYYFNMQFDFDPSIKGDLSVKASGTASLMQREVKSQRIMNMMQIGSNPMVAPFVNFEYLVKEAARSLDLDPEKATNDPRMAALQAAIQGQMNTGPAQGGQQGPSMADSNQVGGGNIAGGGAPAMPGEQQFSGSPQPQGGQGGNVPTPQTPQ